jgi:hypothetical protein
VFKDPASKGRFRIRLSWLELDPRATAEIAIVYGRYGTPAPDGNDYAVSGDQTVPGSGQCGEWLRDLGDNSFAYFDGLAPGEQYCFRVWATTEHGANSPATPSSLSLPACVMTPKIPQP